MTAAEYWEGDPSLPRAFRSMDKQMQERTNREAWLHGLYVYDAVSAALTHLSPKKEARQAYTSKPYSFTLDEKAEEEKVIEAEAQAEVWMKSWASATQKMFDKK